MVLPNICDYSNSYKGIYCNNTARLQNDLLPNFSGFRGGPEVACWLMSVDLARWGRSPDDL